jgi:hypothetical protein
MPTDLQRGSPGAAMFALGGAGHRPGTETSGIELIMGFIFLANWTPRQRRAVHGPARACWLRASAGWDDQSKGS